MVSVSRKPVRIGRVVLGLSCAIAVAAVAAQTAERPAWKVGDRWQFQQEVRPPPVHSEWTRKVAEALPNGHFKVRTDANAVLEFDDEGNSLDKRGADYSWRRFDFPLSVGKSWKHERKIAGDMWNGIEASTWTVRAHEKLTVPAGTFECFRVEGETHSTWASAKTLTQNWNRGHTLTTYWYCPEVKWPAKWIMENQAYLSATRTFTTSELVKFEPGL